jgi:hypothetical protein
MANESEGFLVCLTTSRWILGHFVRFKIVTAENMRFFLHQGDIVLMMKTVHVS